MLMGEESDEKKSKQYTCIQTAARKNIFIFQLWTPNKMGN